MNLSLVLMLQLCITTVGCVVLFVYPQPLYELATAILQIPEIAHGK